MESDSVTIENNPAGAGDNPDKPVEPAGENRPIDPCPTCGAQVERIEPRDAGAIVVLPCGDPVLVTMWPDRIGLSDPANVSDELSELMRAGVDVDAPVELPEPCELPHVHGRHEVGTPAERWTCPGRDVAEPAPDDLGSYAAMFAEYLAEQKHWIGAPQQPLVFHIRKLCAKLDADPDAPASLSSAYLQAISRLDRQRPGSRQPAGADGDLPGQRSIFDELD